ncbi:hypothetical protein E2C01_076526 [Portunus trituberculatus]|uniref:Uncharacterized protein n=1 Tax=Portunus trituberculatus TaxID=210409 RepID=A0A5B7IMA0_PORTR|nr:hypothetical protein [Portunus trituberculatus]
MTSASSLGPARVMLPQAAHRGGTSHHKLPFFVHNVNAFTGKLAIASLPSSSRHAAHDSFTRRGACCLHTPLLLAQSHA